MPEPFRNVYEAETFLMQAQRAAEIQKRLNDERSQDVVIDACPWCGEDGDQCWCHDAIFGE